MNELWKVLIGKIVDLLWAALRQKIIDWLTGAEAALEGDLALVAPDEAVRRVFAAARAKTRWWRPRDWAVRRGLAACEATALRYATELKQAALYGDRVPVLNVDERAELENL